MGRDIRHLVAGFIPRVRIFLAPDYILIQAWMRPAAILGSLGYVAFHFIETGLGYRDWWPLRLACILVPLFLLTVPRKGMPSR